MCQQILLKEPRRSATLLPFSRTSPRGRRRKRTTRPWLQQGFVRRVRFSQKMPNALTALAIQPCLRPSPPRSPSLDKVGWISTLSGAPSRRIVTLLGSRSDSWSHPQGDQRDAWASLLCPRQAHNGCVLGAGEEVMPMHLLDIIVTAGCTWQVRHVWQLTFYSRDSPCTCCAEKCHVEKPLRTLLSQIDSVCRFTRGCCCGGIRTIDSYKLRLSVSRPRCIASKWSTPTGLSLGCGVRSDSRTVLK